ncbi:hypothetical protein BU24DRAFT_206464 [Aaosphaeria arxii CBS 175.79]|uniref:Uncharacterized protein n=1 Tax=Aaosphaeria arxii CBS 175.79 TaxID=1450172 RepID=A0A6A5XTT0_9PLEO|nr:uncharacterized protein BU24DRAFT_206464 [Aaosphaeria arxii CBS 175.79]KAF2016602.1 hypothetical protein BU24DRAFT_206464 [Aaosphaeria arxii CBS 175.79]
MEDTEIEALCFSPRLVSSYSYNTVHTVTHAHHGHPHTLSVRGGWAAGVRRTAAGGSPGTRPIACIHIILTFIALLRWLHWQLLMLPLPRARFLNFFILPSFAFCNTEYMLRDNSVRFSWRKDTRGKMPPSQDNLTHRRVDPSIPYFLSLVLVRRVWTVVENVSIQSISQSLNSPDR